MDSSSPSIILVIFAYFIRYLTERGVVEVLDLSFPPKVFGDGSLPPFTEKWASLLIEATAAHGCPIDNAKNHKSQLEDAGFVDIVENTYMLPQNQWPADRELKDRGMVLFQPS